MEGGAMFVVQVGCM
jgi:NADH:ubiquinone oxidoreductase subunit 6 (subunit J)